MALLMIAALVYSPLSSPHQHYLQSSKVVHYDQESDPQPMVELCLSAICARWGKNNISFLTQQNTLENWNVCTVASSTLKSPPLASVLANAGGSSILLAAASMLSRTIDGRKDFLFIFLPFSGLYCLYPLCNRAAQSAESTSYRWLLVKTPEHFSGGSRFWCVPLVQRKSGINALRQKTNAWGQNGK